MTQRLTAEKPLDEVCSLLRGVNEECRTWGLKNQRIQLLLKSLETVDPDDGSDRSKLPQRLHQMLGLTLGHAEAAPTGKAPSESATIDSVSPVLRQCEEVVKTMQMVGAWTKVTKAQEGTEPKTIEKCDTGNSKVSSDHAPEEKGQDAAPAIAIDEQAILNSWSEAKSHIEEEYFTVRQGLNDAEMDLKDFEMHVFQQWLAKKKAAEQWSCLHSALIGTRDALRLAKVRYDRERETEGKASRREEAEEVASSVSDTPHAASVNTQDSSAAPTGTVLAELDTLESELSEVYTLSDFWDEGSAQNAQRREAILKEHHPGSELHPHGCRACHFQGGLCWQGLKCSFCHICPKPKRKSKHQRDVDKRRQERYRQVKAEHGLRCLEELTKVDESRRQIMTWSEELKKRVKDAYSSNVPDAIDEAHELVQAVQGVISSFSVKVKEVEDRGILTSLGTFSNQSEVGSVTGPIMEENPSDDESGVSEKDNSVVEGESASTQLQSPPPEPVQAQPAAAGAQMQEDASFTRMWAPGKESGLVGDRKGGNGCSRSGGASYAKSHTKGGGPKSGFRLCGGGDNARGQWMPSVVGGCKGGVAPVGDFNGVPVFAPMDMQQVFASMDMHSSQVDWARSQGDWSKGQHDWSKGPNAWSMGQYDWSKGHGEGYWGKTYWDQSEDDSYDGGGHGQAQSSWPGSWVQ